MAFIVFQLLTATLFLRPAEIVPWLADAPIYEGLIVLCLALSWRAIEPHFRRSALVRQPIVMCAAGMLFAVVLSHASHLYLGGVYESGVAMLKTLVYFSLVLAVVNTPSRLRAFLRNVAACGSLMVTLCLLDYWGVLDFEFIQHLQDVHGHDEEGKPIFVSRMRGTGIFQDPNDLAMVIVACGALCFYFLGDRRQGGLRFAWLVPAAILLVALLETKSRGGMLAAVSAAVTLSLFSLGPKLATMAAILGAVTLPVLAGRGGDIDLEDGGTAHERLLMWREGFHALKSPDLLFGVGQGMYAEVADLVAHNSFVHAYVELGVVGGTLFFGCFYFAAVQLYRIGRLPDDVWSEELLRARPYLAALLAGWCGSMFSLSRCYIVPTFLVLGVMAAYANLVWVHTKSRRPLIVWDRVQACKLCVASALMFLALYAFTVVFT
jgi:hypothetical protein